ncbi:MAG: hypothetical protein ACRDD1_07735, partial [Planctomycetia bacterium]
EKALANAPDRWDWSLGLAQVRYERRDYAESDRLATAVAASNPTSELAGRARLLREKIDLATAGRFGGGNGASAAPAAN